MIAVAVVLFGVQARAGVITQTSRFNYAPHGGSGSDGYNQFDPSLGTLGVVAFTVTYSLGSGFEGFQFTNPTSSTITFNASLFGTAELDGCFFGTTSTVPVTLGPFSQSLILGLTIPPGFQSSNVETTGLDRYVGTGLLTPITAFGDGATVDNPLITISNVDGARFTGTETITYDYLSPLPPPVPAPPSLVLLSVGLVVIGGLAWRRRKAKVAA
jgi:hypothetical protein